MEIILTNILLAAHIVSAAMWVGAVFMGAFVDPPALRTSADSPWFLVNFIVAQGVRIFVWVYLAMGTILVTGVLLVWLHPPQTTFQVVVLAVKGVALAVMAGNTLYGTLVTWPKIQFANTDEVPILWRPYLIRAYITFGCGVLGFILGVLAR
jgi:hypothetical protein